MDNPLSNPLTLCICGHYLTNHHSSNDPRCGVMGCKCMEFKLTPEGDKQLLACSVDVWQARHDRLFWKVKRLEKSNRRWFDRWDLMRRQRDDAEQCDDLESNRANDWETEAKRLKIVIDSVACIAAEGPDVMGAVKTCETIFKECYGALHLESED